MRQSTDWLFSFVLLLHSSLGQRDLPPEGKEFVQRVINYLAERQDWCGPGAAVLEGRWRELLTQGYWLFTDAELPIPSVEQVEAFFSSGALPTSSGGALSSRSESR